MMGSVGTSGSPDGGHRRRESTREVFSCVRSCERGAQKARKNRKKKFISRKGAQHNSHITDEEMAFTRISLPYRRMI